MSGKRTLHIIIGIVMLVILAVAAVLLLLPTQGSGDISNAKLVMNEGCKERFYG